MQPGAPLSSGIALNPDSRASSIILHQSFIRPKSDRGGQCWRSEGQHQRSIMERSSVRGRNREKIGMGWRQEKRKEEGCFQSEMLLWNPSPGWEVFDQCFCASQGGSGPLFVWLLDQGQLPSSPTFIVTSVPQLNLSQREKKTVSEYLMTSAVILLRCICSAIYLICVDLHIVLANYCHPASLFCLAWNSLSFTNSLSLCFLPIPHLARLITGSNYLMSWIRWVGGRPKKKAFQVHGLRNHRPYSPPFLTSSPSFLLPPPSSSFSSLSFSRRWAHFLFFMAACVLRASCMWIQTLQETDGASEETWCPVQRTSSCAKESHALL